MRHADIGFKNILVATDFSEYSSAALIVIGTVGRSGIQGMLLGILHAAENEVSAGVR